MKILMLTPYLPFPPASGGQIRTLNLLRYLSRKNEVTLISLYKNEKEKQYESYLESYCNKIYLCKRAERPWQFNNVIKAILSPLPFLVVRNYSDEARETVKKLLKNERFDVIHAETFYIMPHIPKTETPTLLVEQTIEYRVYQHFVNSFPFFVRPFFYLDIIKLKYWEQYYWKKASVVAAVSEADQALIHSFDPTIKTVIVPNGAGDEMFAHRLHEKKLIKPLILFMGNFSWLQNVEAADFLIKHVFPLLSNEIPEVNIIVAGQQVRRKIKDPNNPRIQLIDIVPNDSHKAKELYRQASLFIAPIFGPGGTRLKILAAIASGLPVISTKIGIQGLKLSDKQHVLLATSARDFADKTQLILNDRKLYESLRRNAYKRAKEKYSWTSISSNLETDYRTIIKRSDQNK